MLIALVLAAFPGATLAAEKTLLVWGDSLSAGYGIALEAAWPSLLQQRLQAQGKAYKVVNGSISGETTAGGRSRLDAALRQHKPAIVVVELGANDGLRGLPVEEMKKNLSAMLESIRQAKAKALLVGMRLPPNFGPYASRFEAAFRDVARTGKTPFVPFLLDGIADKPELFQADGLHPVAKAQPAVLDTVWRELAPLL